MDTELFRGPTLLLKDVALQLWAVWWLMFLSERKEKLVNSGADVPGDKPDQLPYEGVRHSEPP